MPDVFISYAREDVRFVERLRTALRDRDREVWLDRSAELGEGVEPASDWKLSTVEAIDRSDAFVLVLSTNSLDSIPCRDELAHAAEVNKRLIPICIEEPTEGVAVPEPIRDLSWILMRPEDSFDNGIEQLIRSLDTDIEMVRVHTRLLVRARAWDAADRRASSLLRGDELRQAEDWLSRAATVGAPPTDLQQEFIVASRRGATRRQRMVAGVSAVVALFAITLSIFALIERSTAIANQKTAQSQLLASQAASTADPQFASLLAMEAYRLAPTVDARSAILTVADNRELGMPLTGGTEDVYSVAFSPDGRTLASGDLDGTIGLWDVPTHREVATLTDPSGVLENVAFSPDGRTLASGFGGTITLWDLPKRRVLRVLDTGTNGRNTFAVANVAFSPDGRTLASGDGVGKVILWTLASRRQLGTSLTGQAGVSVAFSPDGRTLASGSDDGTIRLWDVASRHQFAQLVGHTGTVESVAFSPDGRTLASGSDDGTIRLWDVASRHQFAQLAGDAGTVYSVAFSPDGRTLASGSSDQTVRFWDVANPRQLGTPLAGYAGGVNSVAFSPDGQTLVSCGSDGMVTLWGVSSRRQLGTLGRPEASPLTGTTEVLYSVAFSPDGRTLASGGDGGTVRLWDIASRRQIGSTSTGSISSVTDIVFSPDGRTLAFSSLDGTVRLWDIATHRQLGKPLTVDQFVVAGVAFSPNGQTLASASEDGSLWLWNVATHRQLGRPLTAHRNDSLASVAFSPDGRTLASSSVDGTITLWDVATHSELGALTGNMSGVGSVAFSHDSQTLASGGQDGTVRLWDVAGRRQLGPSLTRNTNDSVNSVAFSPDGKTLASGNADGTVVLWTNEPIKTYIRQVCRYINLQQAPKVWKQAEPSIPFQNPC